MTLPCPKCFSYGGAQTHSNLLAKIFRCCQKATFLGHLWNLPHAFDGAVAAIKVRYQLNDHKHLQNNGKQKILFVPMISSP